MSWFIKKNEGFCIEDGEQCKRIFYGDHYVATVYEEDGVLNVDLGMNSNFRRNDGEFFSGWICEEHILSVVHLEEGEEGSILFQKDRHSTSSDKNLPEISLEIIYQEGVIVPKKSKSPRKKKFFFSRLLQKAS